MAITLIIALALFIFGIYPLVNAFFYYRRCDPRPTLAATNNPNFTIDSGSPHFESTKKVKKANERSRKHRRAVAASRRSSKRGLASVFINSKASKAHELRDQQILQT